MAEETKAHRLSRLLPGRGHRHSKPKSPDPNPEKLGKIIRRRVRSFKDNPPGPLEYDEKQNRFMPEEEAAMDDLQQILEEHDGEPATKLKLTNASWDTVFESMAAAKEERESKTETSGTTAVVGEVATNYIELIPEEYGLGLIKGGLALVFEASKRRTENKDKILEAFETVPETALTINTAFALLNPEPEDLKQREDFFSMLLVGLPKLIKILLGDEPWYKRLGKGLLLNVPDTLTIDDILGGWNGYLATLQELVERMKIRLQASFGTKLDALSKESKDAHNELKDQFKRSHDELKDEVIDSHDDLKDQIRDSHDDLKDKVIEVGASTTSILTLLRTSSSLQQALGNNLQNIRDDLQVGLSNGFRESNQVAAAAFTGFKEVLEGIRRDMKQERQRSRQETQKMRQQWAEDRERWEQERLELERETSNLHDQLQRHISDPQKDHRLHSNSAAFSPIQLLGAIGVNLHAAWDDLDLVIRETNRFDAETKARAEWLMTTKEFTSWLTITESSLLLVDACSTIELISPMSGLCAGLFSGLVDDEESIMLIHFGGLHCRPDDDDDNLQGPKGIMRSLIAQLLFDSKLQTPDLGFVSLKLLRDCAGHNLKALCHVFVHLAEQLPIGTQVICIIDGVSWFEDSSWRGEMDFIVAMFEKLAKSMDPEYSGIIKVLMTSPGKSIHIVRRTMKADTLWQHASLAAGHVHPGNSVPQPTKSYHFD